MVKCEDCGSECKRRIRCFHCGLLVCSWCWGHVHRCEPGHKRENCNSYKAYKKYGKRFLDLCRELMKQKGKIHGNNSQQIIQQ